MANIWDADVNITSMLCARLIDRQFPALSPAQLEPFGIGWDNTVYLVNERYVFRFPHRKMGADLIDQEIRILPLLTPYLPLPVPFPEFVGHAELGYPYPFAGYPLIPGITACRFDWTGSQRAKSAKPLAGFLASLHGIRVDDKTRSWARGDFIDKANLPKRAIQAKERLNSIRSLMKDLDIDALIDLVDRLAATPMLNAPSVWVHGDLYPRHLIVDEAGELKGIIDWGDAHLGDPALDLSIAWTFLPPEAHDEFRKEYGGIVEATWRRARFRAIYYGAILVRYGAEVGDEAIRRVGEFALWNSE